jgi:tetratricopeptide (TPR) repeat protein
MGVNPVQQQAAQPAPAPRPQAGVVEAAPPHADNRARLKAWRLIDDGDAEFKQRRFAQALTRYRDAAAAARDLAAAQFRQGFALAAITRYTDAAKAFIRGLQLDPDWPDSDFKLDEIYGENKGLEKEHIDALQKALAAHPHDADVLFVLGIYLYFGDHPADSAPLFERAQAVVGPLNDDHLTGFLKHFATDKVPPAKPGEKPAVKVPPPPLPIEDKPQAAPGGAKPADRGALKPEDPFEGLDPSIPMSPRRIP